jgi:hypothetical protein
MGVVKRQVIECTCDVCGAECDRDDGAISVQVNGGDRDVGPASIYGTLTFYQPYKCATGIVCRACKIKWLKIYLKDQEQSQ